jgi:peptidylprolyl isomerase
MTKNNILSVLGVMVVCGVLVAGLGMWLGAPDTPNVEVVNKINEPLTGPLTADQLEAYQVDMTNKDNPVAVFNTNQGVIELELFEDIMPITAGNFEKLVSEGFYDGVKFHRVIDGFMIQGGDPITKTEEFLRYGTGGPGYAIADEHVAGEYLTNVRGTISMANSGPNSGGSQFFINLGDNTNLDFDKQPLSSKHPVFGRVISGMGVVDAIGKTEVNDRDLPVNDVVIESVVIERRG